MKILHLSYTDMGGGANIALDRIKDAIRLYNIESYQLVVKKQSDKQDVIEFGSRPWSQLKNRIKNKISALLVSTIQKSPYSTTSSINLFNSHIVSFINQFDADIVHLHWIGNETLSIKDISRINKPIVWTFHDLWPILGSEHIDISFSNRYKHAYNESNRPAGYKGIDLEKLTWKRKFKYWKNINIWPVAVSKWVENAIMQSPIFAEKKTTLIGNPLNTDFWSPLNSKQARTLLGISLDNKIVVIGAEHAIGDLNKGFDKFKNAIEILSDLDFTVVVFGGEYSFTFIGNHSVVSLGRVHDSYRLKLIYCAADIIVVPSLQETFCQVASESLACGTPVVAFANSGLLDLVDHLENGYLAKPFDPKDLAAGIRWTLDNRNSLKDNAILKAQKFNYQTIGKKYKEVYEEVLAKK